jgi:hypothetical protein
MDPTTLALLLGGGQFLQGIGGFLGGGPQRDLQRLQADILKQQFGRRTGLQNQFTELLRSGDVVGQRSRNRFTAGFNQNLSNILSRLTAGAARSSSPTSPEQLRSIAQAGGRQAGQFQLGLEQTNLNQLQDLRRLLLGSTFGG